MKMDCIFFNPHHELDLLVDLAQKDERVSVHNLNRIEDYLNWDFKKHRPGVIFIHLETLLSFDRDIQHDIVVPFHYTCIITKHEERPAEADFIWKPEIFTLSGAAEMLHDIIPVGIEIVKGHHRLNACEKFEVFSLPVLGSRLIRIRAHDIIWIRIIGTKGVEVATVKQTYMSNCDPAFFENIDFIPDFKFANPQVLINISMVEELAEDSIKMLNGQLFTLEKEYHGLFLETLELDSSKFYFRREPLHIEP